MKQLITDKLIIKEDKKYKLTSSGKDFANRLDVDSSITKIGKQAKVGVIIYAFMGRDSNSEIIAQTSLKEPFYGFIGAITGKIKFGETSFDTAKRELLEETGLRGDLSYHGVAHYIHIVNEEVAEDKFLFCFTAYNCIGELIKEVPGMSHELMSIADFRDSKNMHIGGLDILDMSIGKSNKNFLEIIYYPENF
ncbi:MAG: NUDIX hydrolase [Candidatus Dojkabacteria bacterium]|nr:NUDIX hydrolase [Candidatus Dojkabacteria bacterium]MDQ7021613.1 NUDIX hydrolase [Candidatus Dojkabacteria bacterium]